MQGLAAGLFLGVAFARGDDQLYLVAVNGLNGGGIGRAQDVALRNQQPSTIPVRAWVMARRADGSFFMLDTVEIKLQFW